MVAVETAFMHLRHLQAVSAAANTVKEEDKLYNIKHSCLEPVVHMLECSRCMVTARNASHALATFVSTPCRANDKK